MRNLIIAGIVVVLGLGGIVYVLRPAPVPVPAAVAQTARPGAAVTVTLPVLDDQARMGQLAFAAKCAACHGDNGAGREGAGPPLIHKIYEPGHHGDFAFVSAARNGVRAHHWRFGDMPAVAGVSDADIANIVAFVRAVQRANGIN